jgi:hypothetical protein
MPGLFDNALAYENARLGREANNKASLEAMRQNDAMQRLMLQNSLISGRMQNSPAMMRVQAAQKKAAETQAQDKATVDWVLSLDPSKVEPQWRYMLKSAQEHLKQNPDVAVAKWFTTKYRPQGLSFGTVQTTAFDPDGNPIPVTSFVVRDPMSGSITPAGMSPGTAAPLTGAAGRSAGAPGVGGTPLSASASALAKKYGLGGGAP